MNNVTNSSGSIPSSSGGSNSSSTKEDKRKKLDGKTLQLVKECVQNIIGGTQTLKFKEVLKVTPFFKSEPGRRIFSQILQQAYQEVSHNLSFVDCYNTFF